MSRTFILIIKISLALLFLAHTFCDAQIAMGTWRTHLSYHNVQSLAITPEGTYGATDNGLFFVDKSSGELVRLSKLDGLSDSQFSKIAYHQALKKLLVTYRNGNIDILQYIDKQLVIKNLPQILTTNRLTDKGINHITFYNHLAYLSTNFGMVQVDMNREVIAESYLQLGSNGESLKVWASAVANDSIYLATGAMGMLKASLANHVNRLDFRNWQTVNTNATIQNIAAKQNVVYWVGNRTQLFTYANGKHQLVTLPNFGNRAIQQIMTSSDKQKILVAAPQILVSIGANNEITNFTATNLISPQEADYEGNTLWIADYNAGLLKNTVSSTQFTTNYPKSIYSASVSHLFYQNNTVIATTGGWSATRQPQNNSLGFSSFGNNDWTNYNSIDKVLPNTVSLPPVRNLVAPTYHPQENVFYMATLTDGLLKADLGKSQFEVISTTNNLPSNQVTATVVDNKGNLWIGLQAAIGDSRLIYRRTNTTTWQAYNLPNLNQSVAHIPIQLLVDEANNLWVLCQSPTNNTSTIVVLNEKGTTKVLENLDLPSRTINSLLLEKEGNLWIGTDKGLRYISAAASVVNRNPITTNVVVFEQRALFRDENITTLAIDGGNRKWIGVGGKGAWLFSADGAENLLHFTTQNSPLPSNDVQSIVVHAQDGEVFFATTYGLASYRGDATVATEDFGKVRIFPNPVLPTFQGLITIDGLAQNSFIKITDVAGRLVHETQAVGGTATWRGTDYTGRKAQTGIYLVFCTNQNGEQSLVGKVAFIE